ncbi:hypothetical protein [Paracoccus sp. (in: a-proteobacteria)]|uniref:hypothetical protein n=1 Tax=Paracoccus sp. TaxID=267 RepID=UPI00405849E6
MPDHPTHAKPIDKARWEIRLGIVSAVASLCTLAVGGYVAIFLSRAELGELVKMNRFEALEAKLGIIEQLGVDGYYDSVQYLYGKNKVDQSMGELDIGFAATFHNRGQNVIQLSHYATAYIYECGTGKNMLATEAPFYLEQLMNILIGWSPGSKRYINANSQATRIDIGDDAQFLHKFPLGIIHERLSDGQIYSISFVSIFYSDKAAAIALGSDHIGITDEFIDRIVTPDGKLVYTPILSRHLYEYMAFKIVDGVIVKTSPNECVNDYVDPIYIDVDE